MSDAAPGLRVDLKALAIATAIESGLAALALFGGPHGVLGTWPWTLQLPGMLIILTGPSDTTFEWRAAWVFAIQLGCWYVICALIRRRARRHTGR